MVDFAAVRTAWHSCSTGETYLDATGRGGGVVVTDSINTTYETVIGLEVHAQLLTRTQDVLRLLRRLRQMPSRTRIVCPVCRVSRGVAGHQPGGGREAAILTGLALNCEIPSLTASSTARTTSTPTCRRATRSPSTICRSASTAALEFESGGEDAAGRDHPRPHRGRHRAPGSPHRRDGRADQPGRSQPLRRAVDGDRRRARPALAGGGARLSDRAAPDPALHRRLDRQHGGGRVPLRRQRLGAARSAADSGPRSKSRT